MIYTGIGSRETPAEVLDLMYRIAIKLAKMDYTLRSGKAPGADTAFQQGAIEAKGSMEIYVPWNKFNNEHMPSTWDICQGSNFQARKIAEELHPAWDKCSEGARKLHTRNVCQILGSDLQTPSRFIIYWAPEYNGVVKGGTATAVRLARKYNIPTVNLLFADYKEKLRNLTI